MKYRMVRSVWESTTLPTEELTLTLSSGHARPRCGSRMPLGTIFRLGNPGRTIWGRFRPAEGHPLSGPLSGPTWPAKELTEFPKTC